jgi:hypothetical protein
MRFAFVASALLFALSGCSVAEQRPTKTAAAGPKADTAVAALSARSTPSERQPSEIEPPDLPALYADLFEVGRAFTYSVDTESSHYDPDDDRAEKSVEVVSRSATTIRCVVSEVRSTPDARFAVLDCGDDGNESFTVGLGGVTPAGIYVATKDGLHRFQSDDPAVVLKPSSLIMPREPKPERQVEKRPDGQSSSEIAQYPDGTWCFGRDDMVGDASYLSLCFSAGKGIVSMVGGWDGGSTHSASFSLTTNS